MSRYALFCFVGRGHLDPGLAIGRRLHARGHEVTVCHLSIAEAAVRRAGLGFVAIDRFQPTDRPTSRPAPAQRRTWSSTIDAVMTHAERTLREAPQALRERRIDAVVADQLDVAAGTVAERAGVPFVSMSCGPPLYLDDSVAPPYFGWSHASGPAAAVRNRRGNAMVERVALPVLSLLNDTRRAWTLPPIGSVNELFSTRGIITQLPAVLELPRARPPRLFYTGPFHDDSLPPPVSFDFARLGRKPLVYASMGTVRNTAPAAFRTMAEAAAELDVQLVMSLGGGLLRPGDLGTLPGDPIVVHYAPQRALLSRAQMTVNCAGLNTTLDSLRCGVPMVAIPVAEDQPGVAARIAAAGAGIVEPFETVNAPRLRAAMGAVLTEPSYRDAARRIQRELGEIDGTEQAVDLIERLLAPVAVPTSVHAGRA